MPANNSWCLADFLPDVKTVFAHHTLQTKFACQTAFQMISPANLGKLKFERLLSEKCLSNHVLNDKNMSVSANQCKLKFAWLLTEECLPNRNSNYDKFPHLPTDNNISRQKFIYSIHYSEIFLSTSDMFISLISNRAG